MYCIGNNDIVAFKRKWDQKSAVLVVSNMSPTNHTVNLKVKDGLMSGKNLADKAKVHYKFIFKLCSTILPVSFLIYSINIYFVRSSTDCNEIAGTEGIY